MFVSDWNLQKAYHHAYYRPQTKFAKVMFLHVSVIPSTGGVPGPGGGCVETPPPGTATAAVGTHPTGMHSCFICILVFFLHMSYILELLKLPVEHWMCEVITRPS